MLKNMLPNNEWVNQETKQIIQKDMETNENETQWSKTFGMQQKHSQGDSW